MGCPDASDLLVPKTNQVIRCDPGAVLLLYQHGAGLEIEIGVHCHNRDILAKIAQHAQIHLQRQVHQDAGNPMGAKLVHCPGDLADVRFYNAAEHHAITGLISRFLDVDQRLRWSKEADRETDVTKDGRAPAKEMPGSHVGPVTELADDSENSVPSGFGYLGHLIDDAGDGLVRNTAP